MNRDTLSFVMVGHIDHGKSTLIGRLMHDTGSLPDGKLEEIEAAARAEGREMEFAFLLDHLAEERERGITIDTAQTFFSSDSRDYVIIDAPGHKEFIKNMMTGASQAEAVILLCSVYEGVQEQTKRHAYVVKMLGLEQVVIAYNKMDMVDYDQERFLAVKRDMNAFLADLGVTPSMEIPISAYKGDNVAKRSENMPWYMGPSIVEALDLFRKIAAPTEKSLRFPVQDVYDVKGEKIVAGRVESGVMKAGQKLHFLPADVTATVRAVKKYNEPDLARAEAGECIGLDLDTDSLDRGQVGCPVDDRPYITKRFKANMFWLSPQALDLDDQDGLFIRVATQEQPVRVAVLEERVDSGSLKHLDKEAGQLGETEVGEVVLETAAPVVLESFYDVQELGRFVVTRGRDVVAGGIVTHHEG